METIIERQQIRLFIIFQPHKYFDRVNAKEILFALIFPILINL